MKRTLLILAVIAILLTSGCSMLPANAQTEVNVETLVAQTLESFWLTASVTPTPTLTPEYTPTPTITPSPEPTATPTLTPTPAWEFNPAGSAVVPILLYHHIAEREFPNRYYVPPQTFEEQMAWLAAHGYTTISIELLVEALTQGADLPPRPVIITFDDGDADVYQNAFPIMQQYGYTGVFYLIGNRINGQDVVTTEMVLEMIASGWEIGSHSMTHVDLAANHDVLDREITESREYLQREFQTRVLTFAYPYGAIDPEVANMTARSGYGAAVGLGTFYTHSLNTLYYLSRIEVRSDYDLDEFSALLPWKE